MHSIDALLEDHGGLVKFRNFLPAAVAESAHQELESLPDSVSMLSNASPLPYMSSNAAVYLSCYSAHLLRAII